MSLYSPPLPHPVNDDPSLCGGACLCVFFVGKAKLWAMVAHELGRSCCNAGSRAAILRNEMAITVSGGLFRQAVARAADASRITATTRHDTAQATYANRPPPSHHGGRRHPVLAGDAIRPSRRAPSVAACLISRRNGKHARSTALLPLGARARYYCPTALPPGQGPDESWPQDRTGTLPGAIPQASNRPLSLCRDNAPPSLAGGALSSHPRLTQ